MKKGRIFTITGLLLITAALCLTAYNIYDNKRAGEIADEMLEKIEIKESTVTPAEEIPVTPPDEIEYPDYVLDPNREMPVEVVDGREYIGVISLPALERELPVQSEWSDAKLKSSPCRYTGSVYSDDMVIAAHNYKKHFGPLQRLSIGSEILFTDIDGNVFKYKVAEIETLQPTAIEEMTQSGYPLTLFTCTLGGQSRVTVRCEKAE